MTFFVFEENLLDERPEAIILARTTGAITYCSNAVISRINKAAMKLPYLYFSDWLAHKPTVKFTTAPVYEKYTNVWSNFTT